jgi:c-di-GMP-binding flagellar brake protein YcgR
MKAKLGRDRREHKRYRIKNGFFAMDSTRFGRIIDISLGGLAFTCIGQEEWEINQGTGHIFGNDALCLEQVPFRLRSRRNDANHIPNSAIRMQRLSLEFVGMNEAQKARLKAFIINNCEGVA